MSNEWLDPLEVEPPRNVLVEALGITSSDPKKGNLALREWRITAFMDDDGEWRIPEVQMGRYRLLGEVFFNDVYRWRDLDKSHIFGDES